MVNDLNSGSSSSTPQFLAEFGGKLYFRATDGSSGNEVWSYTAPALPVEYASWDAGWIIAGNTAELEWMTASESNTDYFEVQKSWDGVQYETMGVLGAAGTSSDLRTYKYRDTDFADTPIDVTTVYYRLKQVDLDGAHKLSSIKTLRYESVDESVFIYPNPANNTVSISVGGRLTGCSVTIRNTLGQSVWNARVGSAAQTP